MSAQTSAPETSSFWSLIGKSLGIFLAAVTFYWAAALMVGQLGQILGRDEEPALAAAPAAPAETPAAPAETPAGKPATPAAADSGAAPAPAPAQAAAPPASADVIEILIKPDPSNPLAYDRKSFSVKAGQKVKLTFENNHPTVPQPHNLVIGVPNSKDKILAAAMQLAADPQGMAKGYIPESADILFHTKLLMPGQTEVLEFTAPAAGQYPYVCTFPGHGILMNGVMTAE